MFIHCELLMLMLVLTLDGRAHTGEIIGGQVVASHSRQYMVFIKRHLSNGQTTYCGGFLLNEDFVMTAAHCKADTYTVSLGVDNPHQIHVNNGPSQNIFVNQDFPFNFPNYDCGSDIMLLKLSKKAMFNSYVRPITLAGQGDSSPHRCSVAGWGRTEKIISISPQLRKINVELIYNQLCSRNIYCSYGRYGPAEGDSGGPLVCENGKAYGVVSAKLTQCSRNQNINIYTNISYYTKWISGIMANA